MAYKIKKGILARYADLIEGMSVRVSQVTTKWQEIIPTYINYKYIRNATFVAKHDYINFSIWLGILFTGYVLMYFCIKYLSSIGSLLPCDCPIYSEFRNLEFLKVRI